MRLALLVLAGAILVLLFGGKEQPNCAEQERQWYASVIKEYQKGNTEQARKYADKWFKCK